MKQPDSSDTAIRNNVTISFPHMDHQELEFHDYSPSIFVISENKLARSFIKIALQSKDDRNIKEFNSISDPSLSSLQHREGYYALVSVDSAAEMPFEQLEYLHNKCGINFIILVHELDTRQLSDTLRAGVRGYLTQDISPEALLASVKLVMTGEIIFPSKLADCLPQILFREPVAPPESNPVIDKLCPVELDLLACLTRGYPNKTISVVLDLPEVTVRLRMKSLLRKLKVENRTQAAVWAHTLPNGKLVGLNLQRYARIDRNDALPASSGIQ